MVADCVGKHTTRCNRTGVGLAQPTVESRRRMPLGPSEPAPDANETAELLERARAGDAEALNELFERHLPVLRRWAHDSQR